MSRTAPPPRPPRSFCAWGIGLGVSLALHGLLLLAWEGATLTRSPPIPPALHVAFKKTIPAPVNLPERIPYPTTGPEPPPSAPAVERVPQPMKTQPKPRRVFVAPTGQAATQQYAETAMTPSSTVVAPPQDAVTGQDAPAIQNAPRTLTPNTASPQPITPPVYRAAYLHNPPPPYPALSRKTGESGTVQLRVLVNTEGLSEVVEVETSSGFSRLDAAALSAVKSWRFEPARQGSQPVTAWVRIPLNFSLSDDASP